MTTFDERESAYENKFVHDEELRFKAEARCNKLLAIWAAEKLGKVGTDLDSYISEVIHADFAEAGDDDVIRKVAGDLAGAASEAEVRAKRAECMVTAAEELTKED